MRESTDGDVPLLHGNPEQQQVRLCRTPCQGRGKRGRIEELDLVSPSRIPEPLLDRLRWIRRCRFRDHSPGRCAVVRNNRNGLVRIARGNRVVTRCHEAIESQE